MGYVPKLPGVLCPVNTLPKPRFGTASTLVFPRFLGTSRTTSIPVPDTSVSSVRLPSIPFGIGMPLAPLYPTEHTLATFYSVEVIGENVWGHNMRIGHFAGLLATVVACCFGWSRQFPPATCVFCSARGNIRVK